jgi:predicted TIM-barrel fold metal-dependent hydrolase
MSAKAIPQAIRMAERFPKVRIILDHCARPVLADGPPYSAADSLFELARHPNVFLPRLVAEFGASRLAWGSNYPSSEGTLPQILAMARQSLICLAAADQDWIFGGTARTLYPALADQEDNQ